MANIHEFVEQESEFLKSENVKNEPVAEIIGESLVVYNERLHIPVKIDGKEFIFDCSKTNARTITDSLGEDTSWWVGKSLVLETYKTKTSDGKMVEAINVKAIKG